MGVRTLSDLGGPEERGAAAERRPSRLQRGAFLQAGWRPGCAPNTCTHSAPALLRRALDFARLRLRDHKNRLRDVIGEDRLDERSAVVHKRHRRQPRGQEGVPIQEAIFVAE